MNNDEARQLFADSKLDYSILTEDNVRSLMYRIDTKMKDSGRMNGTLRCNLEPEKGEQAGKSWLQITCKSFYFDDREAISFNADGFIGFAGWASSGNVQPILEAFAEWVSEMTEVSQQKPQDAA